MSINSKLIFKNYVVEKVEFEANFEYSGKDRKIDFDFNSNYTFDNNNFILNLETIVFPKSKINDYPFTMKVKLVGLFEVESGTTEKDKIDFAEKNSIAILFPYIRALISVYTSNANIGAIILPPINVVKYLQDKKLKEI